MKVSKIRKVTPLDGRRLRLQLDDGRVIDRDVTPFLTGPIFAEVRRDDRTFRTVKLEGGSVVWPNGADLCPDVLIWGGPPPDSLVDQPMANKSATTRDDSRSQNLADRLIRARSWIVAATALPESQWQEIFIALFIAFNAMYGKRQYEADKSQTAGDLEAFIDKLHVMHEADLETGRATLTNAIFRSRSAIAAIVTNVFLRDEYWRREVRHDILAKRFETQYRSAERRLKEGDWKPLLRLALKRSVVLRNQIFHGCVTHGSVSRGWESVEQGISVLKSMIPAFAEIMERHGDHPKIKWDPLPYPRLGSSLRPERSRLA